MSAVVLSVGEPFTQRAIDSLSAQTVQVCDIVVVENVTPFFRAINEGAARVTTPFFVQVDADMILDHSCVGELLARVRDDTGIVVGELRDALMGQVVGVKLFRTACFRGSGMPDSISPDTEFGTLLQRAGWRTVYLEPAGEPPGVPRPTLGEHRPEYTPSYTFRKMMLEGSRLRHRGARHGLFWRMGELEESDHPISLLAQVALAHGFFLRSVRDELKAPADNPRADRLAAYLAAEGHGEAWPEGLFPLDRNAPLRELFRRFLTAGEALSHVSEGAVFRSVFARLAGVRRDTHALVAKVALGHGLLMEHEDRAELGSDERAFGDFMMHSIGRHPSLLQRLRARALHLARAAGLPSRPAARW